MFKPGLICRKTAGKEKGQVCIVLEVKDSLATIDGYVKKRKCNIGHLEPLATTELPKEASHEDIIKLLEALGFRNNEIKKRGRGKKQKWNKKSKAR